MIKKLTPFHRELEIRSIKRAIEKLKQKKNHFQEQQSQMHQLRAQFDILKVEQTGDLYEQKSYKKKMNDLMGFFYPEQGRQMEVFSTEDEIKQVDNQHKRNYQLKNLNIEDEEQLIQQVKKMLKTGKIKKEETEVTKQKRIRKAKEKICECCKKNVIRHICEHTECKKPCPIQERALKFKNSKEIQDEENEISKENDDQNSEFQIQQAIAQEQKIKSSPRKTRRSLLQDQNIRVNNNEEEEKSEKNPEKIIAKKVPMKIEQQVMPQQPKKRGRKKKILELKTEEKLEDLIENQSNDPQI